MARDRIETLEVHDFCEQSWRLNTAADSDRPLQRQQQWRLDLSWLQADGEPLSQQSLKQSLEAGACGQVATEGDGHMMFSRKDGTGKSRCRMLFGSPAEPLAVILAARSMRRC